MTSIAEQAREITGEILSAARNRRKAVGRLRDEAREFMSTAVTRRRVEESRRVRQLRSKTEDFLKACNRQQNEVMEALARMAAEVHVGLADQDARRLEAFQQMHDKVTGRVNELAKSTHRFLAASEAQRNEAFGELHGRIRTRLVDLQHGAHSTLEQFRGELEELRQDLRAAGEAWQEFARRRAEFRFSTTGTGDFSSSAEQQLQDNTSPADKGGGGGHIKPHRQSAKERHKAVASRRNDDRP